MNTDKLAHHDARLAAVVALVVYVLLHQALDRLLGVLAKRPPKA